MITFKNLCNDEPYQILKECYDRSLEAGQNNIEAISISSFSFITNEVNSRYVNLKFIDKDEFIFFSNYNSPKAKDFKSHNQITALIYWNSINTQIRLKANINKTSKNFNKSYFMDRDKKKNALAISSSQSNKIESYKQVELNYQKSLDNDKLTDCPDYWGGFSFIPYYFEFWQGHQSRLNKRKIYELQDNKWENFFLEP